MASTTDLRAALADPDTVARYRAKTHPATDGSGCLYWSGALSGRGHGRFWIGGSVVVVAHRFGWALAHGPEALVEEHGTARFLAHACDTPICQSADHLRVATPAQNREEWARRRHTLGSPLRDTRGPLGRARAIRDALLRGEDPTPAAQAGMPEIDRAQIALW